MTYRSLIAGLIGLSLVTADAWAASDISGMWEITIERASGPVNDTFVVKQEGEKLSGSYSGLFGEYKVVGTVKEDKAVFGWQPHPPPEDDGTKLPPPVILEQANPYDGGGKRLPTVITFHGTLHSPTKMTGTVGAPFGSDGQTCKWTAIKKK
jgi:hypothetical protein